MKKIVFAALAVAVMTTCAMGQSTTSEAQKKVIANSPSGVTSARGANFIDADGDGVCDNFGTRGGMKAKHGRGNGLGDGTGNKGIGPKDGTGFGAGKGNGSGVCDGTGPKGFRGGR
jgi:hypothetical protein